MEANKDAALHYIELAEKAIRENEKERAIRYLNKSQELFPTEKAKSLRERIINSTSHSDEYNKFDHSKASSSNQEHSTTNNTSSHTRQRATTGSNNDYTSEEVEATKKIRSCKDYYQILGISKTATEAELKKAYRKLALQFHPDKCKAPGATEAFKAINKAFSILSDPSKRQQYDQYGHAMEPQHHHTNSNGGYYYQSYGDDDDDEFSPDEIFNLFFGYSAPTNRTSRHRRYANTSQHTSTQNVTYTLAQFLPYLILFLIPLLGTLFVSEPQFQMHRSDKYSLSRRTRTMNIEYFVKPDFRPPETNHELDKLETTVIDEYVSDLRHQCYREQQYKESLLWRARLANDNNLYRQAQKQTTPSCTKLNNLYT